LDVNTFICNVCGGRNQIIVNRMLVCARCGNILMEPYDIYRPSYKQYREFVTMYFPRFTVYRLKRKLDEICSELDVPPNIRLNALHTALKICKECNSRMKATTLALISLAYAIKLSGNIALYEKMKRYIRSYRRGRNRLNKIKSNVLRSMGARQPPPDVLSHINLYVDRVLRHRGKYIHDMNYVNRVVRTAVNLYISNRLKFLGKKPNTIATVMLYLAEEKLGVRRRNRLFDVETLSKVSGVSVVTIRLRANEYKKIISSGGDIG